jgi:hypothetical protein
MAQRTVTVWVGTRKGVYTVESTTKRRKWTVRGPYHPGTDCYHVAADPRTPGMVYALLNSAWWGPRVVRSKNDGKTWREVAPPMMALSKDREHGPDGAVPVGPIINLWHMTPGPSNEPKRIFLGVDPGSLYVSDDSGDSWSAMNGLNQHSTRPKWNPGAGGMCLHTIIVDESHPKRMYAGISAAGVFRSDDAGEHWTPMNQGVRIGFQPDHTPEVGQCVHKIVLDPVTTTTVYRQDHDGIHVSHDSGEHWTRVGRPLETDFGFAVTAPKTLPGEAFFVPLDPTSRTGPGGQLQVYRWSEKRRSFSPTMKGKPFPGDIGMHREGLDSDALDPAGLYLGTTSGNLFVSPDGAKSWLEVPYRFPAIHSVSVHGPAA